MEENIIILSASNWSMADENTGEIRKGTTLWYVLDTAQSINMDGSCGQSPVKATLDYDYLDVVKSHGGAPIKATAHFHMRAKGNRMVTEIQSITYPEKK